MLSSHRKHDADHALVDGSNVQPLEVDSIQIYAGQRYSFVLHANQKPDNYCMRLAFNDDMRHSLTLVHQGSTHCLNHPATTPTLLPSSMV